MVAPRAVQAHDVAHTKQMFSMLTHKQTNAFKQKPRPQCILCTSGGGVALRLLDFVSFPPHGAIQVLLNHFAARTRAVCECCQLARKLQAERRMRRAESILQTTAVCAPCRTCFKLLQKHSEGSLCTRTLCTQSTPQRRGQQGTIYRADHPAPACLSFAA